jgi:hypothetical protein
VVVLIVADLLSPAIFKFIPLGTLVPSLCVNTHAPSPGTGYELPLSCARVYGLDVIAPSLTTRVLCGETKPNPFLIVIWIVTDVDPKYCPEALVISTLSLILYKPVESSGLITRLLTLP